MRGLTNHASELIVETNQNRKQIIKLLTLVIVHGALDPEDIWRERPLFPGGADDDMGRESGCKLPTVRAAGAVLGYWAEAGGRCEGPSLCRDECIIIILPPRRGVLHRRGFKRRRRCGLLGRCGLRGIRRWWWHKLKCIGDLRFGWAAATPRVRRLVCDCWRCDGCVSCRMWCESGRLLTVDLLCFGEFVPLGHLHTQGVKGPRGKCRVGRAEVVERDVLHVLGPLLLLHGCEPKRKCEGCGRVTTCEWSLLGGPNGLRLRSLLGGPNRLRLR